MIRRRHLAGLLAAGLLPVFVHAAQPYDPAAPVPPPRYLPLPEPDALPELGELDWREANDTVGQFTRGHIDVLRWESEQAAATPADPGPAGALLNAATALRLALATQPALLATTNMSRVEQARADIEAAAFSRDVLRAWVSAVAAGVAQENARKAFDAAETGAVLAGRMVRVGNWGRDRLLREQRTLKDAGVALVGARQEAIGTREALARMAGLWGEAGQFTLPAALPALPDGPMDGAGLEALALSRHPQLVLASQEAERARRAQGAAALTRWQAVVGEALDGVLGGAADDAGVLGEPPLRAALIDLPRAALGNDAAHAARTVADAEQQAVRVRSQVREAYLNYRLAHDLAAQALGRQTMQVAQQEEVLLRYNGMLKSTWDLLDAARERLAAETAAAQALRDFWLAHVNLQAVLAGADYTGADALARPAGKKAGGGH